MKKVLLAASAAAFLSGCAASNIQANINAIESDLTKLNNGIATVESFASTFCPSLGALQITAQGVACAAHANAVTQAVVVKTLAAANAFCSAPAATNIASLGSQVQNGVIAVQNAQNAGCLTATPAPVTVATHP